MTFSLCTSISILKNFLVNPDLFAEKLPHSPLGDYFPDYHGRNGHDSACDYYLLHRFVRVSSAGEQIYTCGYDMRQIISIFFLGGGRISFLHLASLLRSLTRILCSFVERCPKHHSPTAHPRVWATIIGWVILVLFSIGSNDITLHIP